MYSAYLFFSTIQLDSQKDVNGSRNGRLQSDRPINRWRHRGQCVCSSDGPERPTERTVQGERKEEWNSRSNRFPGVTGSEGNGEGKIHRCRAVSIETVLRKYRKPLSPLGPREYDRHYDKIIIMSTSWAGVHDKTIECLHNIILTYRP